MTMILRPTSPVTPVRTDGSLRAVVVRRAVPVVASVASVVVATLAAERALAGLALRAASSVGLEAVAAAPRRVETGMLRSMVTETTVVERITTRRR
jgi:hypothetical protein